MLKHLLKRLFYFCILIAALIINSSLLKSAESSANISATYGSDGIMTINASYEAECTPTGPILIIMSNYLQIYSGYTFSATVTEDFSNRINRVFILTKRGMLW